MAISGHQTVLCRYRCRLLLAEIPKGSDRNVELAVHTFGKRAKFMS